MDSNALLHAVLAADPNRMSVQEKEQVLWGAHGVAEAIEDEQPDFGNTSLGQFDAELDKIQEKSRLQSSAAVELNPRHVGNLNFRLKLLRAN
jgi:hypothetical protein